MKKNKNYFSYSNREHKSYLLVGFIIFLFVSARLVIAYLPSKPVRPNQQAIALIKRLQNSTTSKNKDDGELLDYTNDFVHDTKSKKVYQYFQFDPNTIDSSKMLELGLSQKQAKTICNYRRKGGKFFSNEDFKKMYCIQEKKYEELKAYIKIDTSALHKNRDFKNKFEQRISIANRQKFENLIIELNDADTTSIQLMKGVGAKLARRIFNYRERLGGFVRKSQLLEVYGVDSVLYRQLESQLVIDTSSLRKININTAYYDNIKLFPYLSRNQAIALINYRNRHGRFSKLDEIKKCVLIDELTYKKVKDYFVLND
jgi:DNA uptake protein ComE-like DNA-binding protein